MSIQQVPYNYPLSAEEGIESYEAMMAPAFALFAQKYAIYSNRTSGEKIKSLTEIWTKRHSALVQDLVLPRPTKEELVAECMEKVAEYRVLRFIREDTLKCIKVFDEIINKCPPPLLDKATLIAQKKMGDDMAVSEKNYKKTVDAINQLIEQRNLLQNLYASIEPPLKELRKSGEPLASLCKEDSGFSVQGAIQKIIKITPFVKKPTPDFNEQVQKDNNEEAIWKKLEEEAKVKNKDAPLEEKKEKNEDSVIIPKPPKDPHPNKQPPRPATYAATVAGKPAT